MGIFNWFRKKPEKIIVEVILSGELNLNTIGEVFDSRKQTEQKSEIQGDSSTSVQQDKTPKQIDFDIDFSNIKPTEINFGNESADDEGGKT